MSLAVGGARRHHSGNARDRTPNPREHLRPARVLGGGEAKRPVNWPSHCGNADGRTPSPSESFSVALVWLSGQGAPGPCVIVSLGIAGISESRFVANRPLHQLISRESFL